MQHDQHCQQVYLYFKHEIPFELMAVLADGRFSDERRETPGP